MPIKIKPGVVRAALLGGVAAIVIALAAHFAPLIGWLNLPLALGTGALAAMMGRHEPGPTLSFAKAAGGIGSSSQPGGAAGNFAGTASESGVPQAPGAADAGSGMGAGGASGGGASTTGSSPVSPTPGSPNDLIPPISDGLVAGLLETLVGALLMLSFLCCSDCLSFFQAAERGAFSRMFALVEQGFFDAVTIFGPAILGAAFGAIGGALGGILSGSRG